MNVPTTVHGQNGAAPVFERLGFIVRALHEALRKLGAERAIEDGLAFDAFSCEYITNLLEARARALPEASPLQLTRRQDLLELELSEPDLSLYEVSNHESKDQNK